MKTILRKTIVLAWAAFGWGANAEPPLPRYQLEVGQELVYYGSSEFRFDGGSHGTTDRTTLWVTHQNADGSWHVVAHNENSFRQSSGKDEKETGQSALGPPDRKEQQFDAFDVFPDGHIAKAPAGPRDRALTALFFKLPADASTAQAGWETSENDGDKSIYRLSPQNDPASGKWIFEKTEKGLFNEIYLSTSKAMIHFDAARGLVTKVESEYSQGYGFNGKGNGLAELKSATGKDREWIEQLAQEADLFVQAKAALSSAYSARNGAKPEEANAMVEKVLREGRQNAKLPIVIAQFDAQLMQLSESAKYFIEDKKQEAAVLNKSAAKWETTDIDGRKHALADYRGKVVILDFWYRGCGWCIKAMPQIKEVVDHFHAKPVAVLGMNTDADEKDARFVVDKLMLNYPTLKAQGLPEKYSVRGFPTLIVIDRQGVVRARHVGYSPKLREELIKTIDDLLASDR
jgi:thiol-disulfide isomerase/thioredoxin